MATLSHSLHIHPSLIAEVEMESALLHDLHWSQEPFDGVIDLPLVDTPSDPSVIGYNDFTLEQLRCANNCSGHWGALWDDATQSGNYARLRTHERNLGFEINRRWKIALGPKQKQEQVQRLQTFIAVMWYFHMKRRGRFGLEPPKPLNTRDLQRAGTPEHIIPSNTASSPLPSPTVPHSRVLGVLDEEMRRITKDSTSQQPLAAQTILSVEERQARLDRRRTKVPSPFKSCPQPVHLRNPRGDPYHFPIRPTPRKPRYTAEEGFQRLHEAIVLGSQPHAPHRSILSSASSSSLQSSSSSPHTSATSQPFTSTTILKSPPTDPAEWLDRLGTRASPVMASHLDILTACLKRALPNDALTASCQFVTDELSAPAIQREYANINSLENVADKFRKVIADELLIRRDELRRRESLLVSNWEDEYQANLREDKEFEAEVAELLHGRRPTPSPPPAPRDRRPYFVSSLRGSGLRAPPTSRIGRAATSPCDSPPPLMSVPSSSVGSPSGTRPTSPMPSSPVDVASTYKIACQFSRQVDDIESDVDKVIGSSFYQDLAQDITVDPSIDRAMVRMLVKLAEGAPEDLLNHCADTMLKTYSI